MIDLPCWASSFKTFPMDRAFCDGSPRAWAWFAHLVFLDGYYKNMLPKSALGVVCRKQYQECDLRKRPWRQAL